MRNLVEVAVKYAKAGFSVLPMSVDKAPLIKFAGKPPLTEEQIRTVWAEHPLALIGLRTTNFFVIDIDRHEGGSDGFAAFREFKETHPGMLRKTLCQKTAGGGLQLFYLKREDMEVRQNIGWLKAVDVKAHENNYIIAPPSERNGKQYTWVDLKQPMVTASKELVHSINSRSNKPRRYQGRTQTAGTTFSTPLSNLFETIAEGLGDQGMRNDRLASFVGKLLSLGVDIETTETLAIIANNNTADSLPEREVMRTVDSIMNSEMRKMGGG